YGAVTKQYVAGESTLGDTFDVRARARCDCEQTHHLRARAIFLLPGAHRTNPRTCCGARLDAAGQRLDVVTKAFGLWGRSFRRLRGLALRRGGALSSMCLVRGTQAAPGRMVVELCLRGLEIDSGRRGQKEFLFSSAGETVQYKMPPERRCI